MRPDELAVYGHESKLIDERFKQSCSEPQKTYSYRDNQGVHALVARALARLIRIKVRSDKRPTKTCRNADLARSIHTPPRGVFYQVQ